MKLVHMLTNQVVIMRLTDAGNDKMMFTTTTSGCMVAIQPQEFSKSQKSDGVFSKTYNLYSDGDISIYQGDKLRDEVGNLYIVRSGGATYRQHGRIGYQKLIVELLDK